MTPQGLGGSDAGDPQEAERALRQAEARGVGGAGLADLLDRSAAAHRRRFWNSGDTQDLHRAVDHYRRAVHADPARRAVWSNELAVTLTDLYDVTGVDDDLAAARRAAEEATAAAEEGSPQWARCAATLVLCLWDLYDAVGSLTDLDTAIDLGGRASAALPHTDRAWARVRSNVGMLLMDRYERLGADDDLQAAVRLAGEAVEGAHPDDPELGGWLNNLGNALLTRHGTQFPDGAPPRPGTRVDLTDLDSAIAAYRRAIAVSGWKVAGRATFLSNLGNALTDRVETLRLGGARDSGEPELREAVRVLAEAVGLTPSTAPYRASRLNVLGEALRALSEETGSADDVDAARTALRQACASGLAVAPEMTVEAAHNWIRWAVRRSAWDEVGEADGHLLRAAEALHRAQSLRRHREAWLLASRGLAQEGAFALTRQGRPKAAVVRLERGRAVLLSEELGLVPALLDHLPAPLRDRYSDAVHRLREALRNAG